MELSDYLRIIRRRGWLIILLAILTAGSAYGFSKMQEQVWKATVKMIVRPARTDFGQAQAAKTLLRSYVVWLDSSFRAQEVIDILELDKTPDELKGNVTIASDDSNFVVQIEVRDTNQQTAGDVARIWGERLIQYTDENNRTQQQADRVAVEMQDKPAIGLHRPNTSINTAAGGVFGALLGLLLIFLLEWIESGVLRRPEDIERVIDVPVIGKIPS